jgi:AraC family transcriptional regulator
MHAVPADPSFSLMLAHGEGRRLPRPAGFVVLSRLPGGRSAIRALAPSVKYVLQGEEVYEIDGRTKRVRPGEFLLVDAGAEIEVTTARNAETIGLCVYFGGEAGAELPDPGRRPLRPRALNGSTLDPLAGLLEHVARTLAERPEAGVELAASIVRQTEAATEAYLAGFDGRLERLGSLKLSTRVETLQRLERARAFLHANAGRIVSLDEVAAHAALSRFHLTRSFAEAYGMPPLAYHRSLRLDAAARLMRDQGVSATAIAEQLGYASLSAFSRAFRQKFGVPPSRMGK